MKTIPHHLLTCSALILFALLPRVAFGALPLIDDFTSGDPGPFPFTTVLSPFTDTNATTAWGGERGLEIVASGKLHMTNDPVVSLTIGNNNTSFDGSLNYVVTGDADHLLSTLSTGISLGWADASNPILTDTYTAVNVDFAISSDVALNFGSFVTFQLFALVDSSIVFVTNPITVEDPTQTSLNLNFTESSGPGGWSFLGMSVNNTTALGNVGDFEMTVQLNNVSVVPEPSTFAIATALCALLTVCRRRRRKAAT